MYNVYWAQNSLSIKVALFVSNFEIDAFFQFLNMKIKPLKYRWSIVWHLKKAHTWLKLKKSFEFIPNVISFSFFLPSFSDSSLLYWKIELIFWLNTLDVYFLKNEWMQFISIKNVSPLKSKSKTSVSVLILKVSSLIISLSILLFKLLFLSTCLKTIIWKFGAKELMFPEFSIMSSYVNVSIFWFNIWQEKELSFALWNHIR